MTGRGAAVADGVLVVFAKAPQPGEVKTRMTPPLSPDQAASLYRAMLADVLDESARACARFGLEGVLSVSPASACGRLAQLVPAGFRVLAQSGPDLGARMRFEVERARAEGGARVLLRGSDNPALGCDEIGALYAALDRVDLALSPDRDGGYGAVALRTAPGTIFDHQMSTDAVLRTTLERARRCGLSTFTSAGSFDLDSFEDLVHLSRVRDRLPADRCPRTLAFVDCFDPPKATA